MHKFTSLKKMQSLSEEELTKMFILPLLENFGFKTIEYRHGSLEKGIDILCLKEDEIGAEDILAIQVKKLKFSGSYTNKGNVYSLASQLEACKTELIQLKDGKTVFANRVWLISPFEMNLSALNSAFEKLKNLKLSNLSIIDGGKLYDQISAKCPDLLVQLGDNDLAYLDRFKRDIPILQEAFSFKMNEKEHLSRQYVQMYLSLLPDRFNLLYHGNYTTRKSIEIKDGHLLALYENFNKSFCTALGLKYSKDSPFAIEKTNTVPLKYNINVNDFKLFSPLKHSIGVAVNNLKKALLISTAKSAVALMQLKNCINNLAQSVYSEALTNFISVDSQCEIQPLHFAISIDQILESRINYQIIADAGSGKTTLLRMIGYQSIIHERLPVFIPLVNRKKNQSLLNFTREVFATSGLKLTETALQERLSNGKLLVLFDGIDEALSKSEKIKEEIVHIIETYPKTQFLVTSRPWASIAFNQNFLTIKVLPFTPEQVDQFFLNWFQNDHSKAIEIIEHLKENQSLYDVVSTPLVATIIVAIKLHGKKLPKSLVDVYNQRLEMLLFDWDNIKGVKRDKFDSEDKLIFLRRLAFFLHSKNQRSVTWNQLMQITIQNVGIITSARAAEDFLVELINNNNLIIKDPSNKWGLGHLQFQEHLAAMELKENASIDKSKLIGDEWWWQVFVIYSSLSRDITALINDCVASNSIKNHRNNLTDLMDLAPNTDKKLKKFILDGNDVTSFIKRISYDDKFTFDFWDDMLLDDDFNI